MIFRGIIAPGYPGTCYLRHDDFPDIPGMHNRVWPEHSLDMKEAADRIISYTMNMDYDNINELALPKKAGQC